MLRKVLNYVLMLRFFLQIFYKIDHNVTPDEGEGVRAEPTQGKGSGDGPALSCCTPRQFAHEQESQHLQPVRQRFR